MQKKTKIVCTIGPATESEEKLAELLKAGMNVMRLNFSHGDFAEHGRRVVNLKKAMKKTDRGAGIIQDLGGPKIRIGIFGDNQDSHISLKDGQTFTLTTRKVAGNEEIVSINYPRFAKEVAVGHIIFIHDGKVKLQVKSIKGEDVVSKVLVGGKIRGKRGVNLPDSDLSISALTEKDKKDLEFGIKHKVDFVALSFVRRPSDIIELREILKKRKSDAGIIAKIETPQAIRCIDEIIELADGIMVARGDLAIEVPAEDVPLFQKEIIRKCNIAGKPVITATQMLESMIHSPVPTRAEVSDVANAILDGTDAVMLSEETTLGTYPVQAVEVMRRIALKIEGEEPEEEELHTYAYTHDEMDIVDSITSSVVKTAHDIGARMVVALTHTGFSARMLSRHKPQSAILAITPSERTANKLCLSWGCIPVVTKGFDRMDEALKEVRTFCLKNKLAKKGDRVVVTAGAPLNRRTVKTNMVLVETI